ncbi:hypothetical protein SK128_021685, partial [Halocaridina rubra]
MAKSSSTAAASFEGDQNDPKDNKNNGFAFSSFKSTGGRRPPLHTPLLSWGFLLTVFSIGAWCYLGWRHLNLEWKVGSLEGELASRLEHRLRQLGLETPVYHKDVAKASPSVSTPSHARVARQAPLENCACPPGQR